MVNATTRHPMCREDNPEYDAQPCTLDVQTRMDVQATLTQEHKGPPNVVGKMYDHPELMVQGYWSKNMATNCTQHYELAAPRLFLHTRHPQGQNRLRKIHRMLIISYGPMPEVLAELQGLLCWLKAAGNCWGMQCIWSFRQNNQQHLLRCQQPFNMS